MMVVLKAIKWISILMIILMPWMELEKRSFKLEFLTQKVGISLMLESEKFKRVKRKCLLVHKPLKVVAFKEPQ